MRRLSTLGTLALIVASPACQRTPEAQAPATDAEDSPSKAGLDSTLHGEYVERGTSEGAQLRHRFEQAQWTESQGEGSLQLALLEQKAQSAKLWSTVFAYTLKSTKERQALRVDLFQADAQTLWICRHPDIAPSEPLSTDPADNSDLEGQGCYGAPWRKLERVQDAR